MYKDVIEAATGVPISTLINALIPKHESDWQHDPERVRLAKIKRERKNLKRRKCKLDI